MLINPYRSFQNSCVIKTGLSDFHKITATVMNTQFQHQKPKTINYRNYRTFSENEKR